MARIFKFAPMFQQQVRTTVLENGITVMSDNMPSALSATVGVWIPRGSRHETPEENGLSHLYEHLVFKGTEHRTAKQIACAIEDRGGVWKLTPRVRIRVFMLRWYAKIFLSLWK